MRKVGRENLSEFAGIWGLPRESGGVYGGAEENMVHVEDRDLCLDTDIFIDHLRGSLRTHHQKKRR